jgi:hypothetical protein
MDTTRDRAEILDLLNRHQIYIDSRNAQGYAGLYGRDGEYESPFASARGAEEILAMFIRLAACGFTGSATSTGR